MAGQNPVLPFVGQALPTRQVYAAGPTTLFDVAAQELGDAMLWEKIADLNGIEDPFLGPLVLLSIPSRTTTGTLR